MTSLHSDPSIDPRLLELLPHRPPMMLLNSMIAVEDKSSESEIVITPKSSFFVPGKGVPSWVGLEYMGQTAALIAGHQLEKGVVEPHTGFLLGTRKFTANTAWFSEGMVLKITCQELAVVGDSLATFDCRIVDKSNEDNLLANTKLSVLRKPLSE